MQLEILTDDNQCARICEHYWRHDGEGEFALKVQEIATTHGMKPHMVSKYVEQHACVWVATVYCVRCKQPYRFGTRGQYLKRNLYKGTVCSDCIEAERQAIKDAKRAVLIEMRQSVESSEVDLTVLDLNSKIYLLAAIQALGEECFGKTEPLSDYPVCTLTPDIVYDQKILRHLIDNHLLVISLNTSLDAIERHGDSNYCINFGMSTFDLALDQHQTTKLINDFSDVSVVKIIRQAPEFIELCKEVQLNECLSFLKAMLEEHQLYLVPGEKTQKVLSLCLEKFSVAQVYNFVWRAARNAAAYYMRSPIYKRQAANSVVESISRNLEQSVANSWDVKSFNRNYKLPQSSLSRVIFNTVLGTDDGGFNKPLCELIEDFEPQLDEKEL